MVLESRILRLNVEKSSQLLRVSERGKVEGLREGSGAEGEERSVGSREKGGRE